MTTTFFSTASNARRAARTRGIVDYTVSPTATGYELIVAAAQAVTLAPTPANTTGDQLGGTVAPDTLPVWAVAPAVITPVANQPVATTGTDQPATKPLAHKVFANYAHSSLLKPVAYVHAYLDANPDQPRNVAMAALCAAGVNYSTARTQYQVWYKARRTVAPVASEVTA